MGANAKWFQLFTVEWPHPDILNYIFQESSFYIKEVSQRSIQILDIWWSSLDIMDDFKLFQNGLFPFQWNEQIGFLSFVKDNVFLILFLVGSYISNYNKNIIFFFLTKFKIIEIIHYVQTWPPDVKNLNCSCRLTFVNY